MSYDILMAATLAVFNGSESALHVVPFPPLPEDDSFGGLWAHILRWDSLFYMSTECESVRQELRRAPSLGPTDTQFLEATVDTLATHKASKPSSSAAPKNP